MKVIGKLFLFIVGDEVGFGDGDGEALSIPLTISTEFNTLSPGPALTL
jgi:hypothetical protein